eukprot:TRINITY_DN31060_c0_g1_i1.p1 TRINITY_DN31060_c0_g1~~TRINITY_DN31060_c0_g1_i1.p1  ORF type:complete len:811 (-),score=107.43 TRINITY_DN31060_c0_g1_i1:26-2380(-)
MQGGAQWDDPSLEEDVLPHPYRMITKLLEELLQRVEHETEQRRREREAAKVFRPPPLLPAASPVSQTTCLEVTMVFQTSTLLFLGKVDGSFEVLTLPSLESTLVSPSVFDAPVVSVAITCRPGEPPLLALRSANPEFGVIVLALPGIQGAIEGRDHSSPPTPDFWGSPPSDYAERRSPTATITKLFTIATPNPVVDLKFDPEGQWLACTTAEPRVLLYSISSLTDLAIPKEPLQTVPISSAFLNVGRPTQDAAGDRKLDRIRDLGNVRASVFFITFEASPAPPLLTPAETTGPLRRTRKAHTLAVGWCGLNCFTTYPLVEYNPLLSNPMALPRNPTVERPPSIPPVMEKKKPAPIPKKGKAKDHTEAQPEAPVEAVPSQCSWDHVLPAVLDCCSLDSSSEILGLGCRDGVAVLWNTVLGVPKWVLNEMPGRTVTTHPQSPMVTTTIEFFDRKYCVIAQSLTKRCNSCTLLVYDVATGLKISCLKYLDRLHAVTCFSVVPFVAFKCGGESDIKVADLKSGEILCLVPTGRAETERDSGDEVQCDAGVLLSLRVEHSVVISNKRAPPPPTVKEDLPIAELAATGKKQRTSSSSKERKDTKVAEDIKRSVITLDAPEIAPSHEDVENRQLLIAAYPVQMLVVLAYPALQDLYNVRDPEALYRLVNTTSHEDRKNTGVLFRGTVNIPAIKSSAKKHKESRGMSLAKAPKGSRAAGTSALESPHHRVEFAASSPEHAAASILSGETAVVTSELPGSNRIRRLLQQRDNSRFDRQQRMKARWHEMSQAAS